MSTKYPSSLPPPPRKPSPDDCCGHDCAVCVFDLYDQELRIWENECEALQRASDRDAFHACQQKSSVAPLEAEVYRDFSITAVHFLAGDVIEFHVRSTLNTDVPLEIGLCQHVVVRVNETSENEENSSEIPSVFSRQLTPYEVEKDASSLKLMIKLKPSGRLSSAARRWKVGDGMSLRGPFGGLTYRKNQFESIFMLSIGVGMAPLLSVIQRVLDDEDEETTMFFHHGCRFYEEICHKNKLGHWSSFWNFHSSYYLSGESEESLNKKRKYGETAIASRLNEARVATIFSSRQFAGKDAVIIVGTPEFELTSANVIEKDFPGQIFRLTNL